MKKTQLTWIDLTDIYNWRGHFTGIQRVVYSYAQRFANDDAKFFVYDKIGKRHVEVELDFVEAQIHGQNEVRLLRRQIYKQKITKPYHALPTSVKNRLRPFAAKSNQTARTLIYKVVDKGVAVSPFREYPAADFKSGDTVVLLGAGWNEPGSLELLCSIKLDTGIKLAVHINDILPIYQPHLFADELSKIFTPYVEMAAKNADYITVISKATERDFKIFCDENSITLPKITVVRLGEDVESAAPKKPDSFPVKGDFILSVGTFEIRKNFVLLYQAAKLAQLEGRDFPSIVIVGRKGWLADNLFHVLQHDPLTKNKIFLISNISDAELNWMYENCMFTVFPSLCEGWGLPIVESLQHGKTCLSSNISSMLEIGDGLIDYFSPYDARSCMDKVIEYAKDNTYQQKNEAVQKRYKSFRWDDSYDSFVKAIDRE
jgi:glycosyltransferase involved in cell wall biosynthesis